MDQMPAIGLGTFPLTGAECTDTVATALSLGYRHVDTAQMYGNEAEVGAGIASAGLPRDELYVVTKIWPDSFEDGSALARARDSIAKLGVGAVDQLLIHWPNPRLSVGAMIEVMLEAKAEGLAKNIGVSNFPITLMREAAAMTKIVTNQVEFHALLDQRKLLAAAKELDIRPTAYMPIARGKVPAHPDVQRIAAGMDVHPAQVALAWVVAKGVTPVCMSTKPANLASNLAATALQISDADMAVLDGLSQPSQRFCERSSDNPVWDI